jgi:hypothetical protein
LQLARLVLGRMIGHAWRKTPQAPRPRGRLRL